MQALFDAAPSLKGSNNYLLDVEPGNVDANLQSYMREQRRVQERERRFEHIFALAPVMAKLRRSERLANRLSRFTPTKAERAWRVLASDADGAAYMVKILQEQRTAQAVQDALAASPNFYANLYALAQ